MSTLAITHVRTTIYQPTLFHLSEVASEVQITNNTFVSNSGVRALVSIDLQPDTSYPTLIYGNNFTQNGGWMEASALRLVATYNTNGDLAGINNDTSAQKRCNGFLVKGNSFTKNVGCMSAALVFTNCYQYQFSDSATV